MTEHEFERCQSWLNRQPLYAIQGPKERRMLRGLSDIEKRKIQQLRVRLFAELSGSPGIDNAADIGALYYSGRTTATARYD